MKREGRIAGIAFACALASCGGTALDLGTNADGGLGANADGASVACSGASDAGAANDGAGYNAEAPPACAAADGPAQMLSSVSEVAQAVVGTWFDCGGNGSSSILNALSGNSTARGIELTGDGHYVVLDDGGSGELVPSFTIPDGATTPVAAGTYVVLDASATLGPGTYQIRLQSSTGGVYLAQVVMLGSPLKMRFVYSTGPSTEELAPALNLKFRAGICNQTSPGPGHTFTGAADTAARITGSWIWCAGPAFNAGDPTPSPSSAPGPVVGIAFPGDGTWYYLLEDDSGNVARGASGYDYGSLGVGDGYLDFSYAMADTPGTELDPVLSACAPTMTFPSAGGTVLERSAMSY